jgi:hypothetical protein
MRFVEFDGMLLKQKSSTIVKIVKIEILTVLS